VKFSTAKQATLHLVVALCFAGLVRADQTTQSVQQALKDQGFYYGNVTGENSAETTAAVRRYQIRNGLQVTGEINSETLRSLNLNSNSASSSQPASKSAVTQSTSVRPDQNSQLGQNASPRAAGEPDHWLETKPAFSGAPYQPAPPRLNAGLVAEVQHQLMSRGYYRGWIDGRYGPRTAFAVRAFQFQSGLLPTGHLDMRTIDALGLSDTNLAYLEPAPQRPAGWVLVKKFKHGKWKVKWKKYHRHGGDEYDLKDREEDREDWWHGHGDDDD
jgi:peptidoglycan hydrolase-like protein with peptidoglycan-binding domain